MKTANLRWQQALGMVMLLGSMVISTASRGESEQRPTPLLGHWRNTTVPGGSPIDKNMVLRADGTAFSWTVTAHSRTEPASGSWAVRGRYLVVRYASGEEMSLPYTFYDGQLVYPNIEGQRKFWERP